jgi:hypothetical protein
MTNQIKYIVEILNNNNNKNKIKNYKLFKTRNDLCAEYKIPLYIVNKLIKKYNGSIENKNLSKIQTQYKDLFYNMNIFVLKPVF